MARRTSASGSNIQPYPRIQDDERQAGLLDDTTLQPHAERMSLDELKGLVRQAIANANLKSSRAILNIPKGAEQAEIEQIFRHEGRELLKYFRKYCGDPAATAHQVYRKTYREVGVEQFRNRALAIMRENSAWRYRFLASDCAGAVDPENRHFSTALQLLHTNFECEEVHRAILEVLMESGEPDPLSHQIEPPLSIIEAFGEACRQYSLLDDSGHFHDPHRLVEFFCN